MFMAFFFPAQAASSGGHTSPTQEAAELPASGRMEITGLDEAHGFVVPAKDYCRPWWRFLSW